MTADHLVILFDGIALGFDACLLLVLGGRIWDDYRDRRAIRQVTAAADARQDRLDALTARGPE